MRTLKMGDILQPPNAARATALLEFFIHGRSHTPLTTKRSRTL